MKKKYLKYPAITEDALTRFAFWMVPACIFKFPFKLRLMKEPDYRSWHDKHYPNILAKSSKMGSYRRLENGDCEIVIRAAHPEVLLTYLHELGHHAWYNLLSPEEHDKWKFFFVNKRWLFPVRVQQEAESEEAWAECFGLYYGGWEVREEVAEWIKSILRGK